MTYKPRTADKFVVRLPDGMRDRIAQAAKESGRSMNSEIVGRISRTFHDDAERQVIIDSMHHLNRQLTEAYDETERLRAEVEALRKDAGRWRKAREILTVEAIESAQSEYLNFGLPPSEPESVRADAAIDAALATKEGKITSGR